MARDAAVELLLSSKEPAIRFIAQRDVPLNVLRILKAAGRLDR